MPSRIAVVESWLVANTRARTGQRGFPITDEDRELAVAAVGEQDGSDTEIQITVDTIMISYTVGPLDRCRGHANLDQTHDPPNYLCSNHLLVATPKGKPEGSPGRFPSRRSIRRPRDRTVDRSSGPSGGDLGCAVEGQFVPEFEEAAYAGAAGDVVGPVETTFGWHLIEIESVGPATVDNHPDADPAINHLNCSTCRGAWST